MPSGSISHCVVLNKMDSDGNYCFKNSDSKNPEIKIPKSRATIDQYNIFHTAYEHMPGKFVRRKLKTTEELFQNILPSFSQEDVSDDGYYIDTGFKLKLQYRK